ncbi:MAG: PilZ domain-containing protein [Gallionella sp.]|nr:PilZ domain-containing protein [Gallionella sp.]
MNTDSDFIPPIDAELPLSDASELSAVLAEACTPVDATPPKGGKEHRKSERYRVKWHAAAFIEPDGLYHGYIKDISAHGAAIFLDKNIKHGQSIKLHIHVPPLHIAQAPHVVEVQGTVAYTVHDAEELQFRVGVRFLRFITEHDPVFLAGYLSNNATRISE